MKQYKQLNPYSIRTQEKLRRRIDENGFSDPNQIKKSEDRKKAMKKKKKTRKENATEK